MKQVVLNTPDNTVLLDNVSGNKYYGVIVGKNSPAYIAADCMLYNEHSYNVRFFHSMTNGNKWLNEDHRTLKDCIRALMSRSPDSQIFEFETYQELFLWASTQ